MTGIAFPPATASRSIELPVQPGVAEVWGRYASAYDAAFTEANHEVARLALERSGLQAGMSVLDIGAGGGALSIPAARLGAKVLATDVSPEMLRLTQRRAAKEGLTIRTAVMDGTDLTVGEQRFDRVCSEFGVMFFPDEGLPEMRRVMASGGKAIVIIWGYPDNVALTLYRLAIERALGSGMLRPEAPLIQILVGWNLRCARQASRRSNCPATPSSCRPARARTSGAG